MKKSTATSLTAAVLAVALLICGGSYAYRIADTQVVTNEFDYKVFDLDLNETVDPDFEIKPGGEDKKDPYFTLTSDTYCYVFMKVDDHTYVDLGDGKIISMVDYVLASGWTQLKDKSGNAVEGIYYYANKDGSIKIWDPGTFSIQILDGDTVTYPEYDLSNEEKVIISQADIYLAFQGWAIEAEPFKGMPDAASYSAYNAWKAIAGEAPDAEVVKLSYPDPEPVFMFKDATGFFKWDDEYEPEMKFLSAVYQFTAQDDANSVLNSEYKDWLCDYYVSVDQDVPDESITLVGHYDMFTSGSSRNVYWVGLSAGDGGVHITANNPVSLMGQMGVTMTYTEICTWVQVFTCGLSTTDAASGATVTVSLRITNPADANDYIVIGSWDYTCK